MRRTRGSHALVTLALTILMLALTEGPVRPARAGERGVSVVTGTGNYTTNTVRTTQELSPMCVSLGTREGTSSFSGLIDAQTGTWLSRFLRDACGPVQGTTSGRVVLDSATIAGQTGSLELTFEGVFEGDSTVSPGSRTRLHWIIQGISGALAGARGGGQSVGVSTAPPFTPTATASANYYFEIQLPSH